LVNGKVQESAMGDRLYSALTQLGYNHPLHPVVVHLPAGLVIAVCLFSVAAMLLRHSGLAQTARHCALLALVSAPAAAAAGLLDWQHFYGGAWIMPFIVKMVLAALLVFSLAVAVFKGMKKDVSVKRLIPIYLFSLVMVAGLGYFGGELVYGDRGAAAGTGSKTLPADAHAPTDGTSTLTGEAKKTESAKAEPSQTQGDRQDPALVENGRRLFSQKCSFCHLTDSTENKIGPGLKGLFERERLPVSGWPTNETSLRRQIQTPYDSMPPFPDLSTQEMDAILSFLKTL
jgi:uncharacterized membrane protein/mono/diheme cytochrome c family protein